MIYSISLNSSIDYVIYSDNFHLGGSANSREEYMYPGGKGINVARVLTKLGMPVKILGFVGGFTGQYIQESLEREGVLTQFIHTKERSRVNLKIKSTLESEINGISAVISKKEKDLFFKTLDQIKEGDLVLLCGKVPACFSENIYEEIMQYLCDKRVDYIVDTTEKALISTLKYGPLYVKPNLAELEAIFKVKITHLDNAIFYGKKLLEKGAKNVVLSLAQDGAILINQEENVMAFVPTIELKNSVGAGDSLVAGMVFSLRKGYSLRKSFHYGVAVSVASALSKTLIESEEIDRIYDKIRLRGI